MSEFVKDRTLIIKKILGIIDPEFTQEHVATAMRTWWQNIRSNGGYQLTKLGDDHFKLAGLQYYDIDGGAILNSMSLAGYSAMVNRMMPAPYYLYFNNRHKILRVYDGRVATAMILSGADHYLKNRQRV